MQPTAPNSRTSLNEVVTTFRGIESNLSSMMLTPVSSQSLTVFRVIFGLTMAFWGLDELRTGRVESLYSGPPFHFTYHFLSFIQPLPGVWMKILFIAISLLALCIAAGFLYRVVTLAFAVAFTYVFLIDQTNYQNHYYLILLLSWCLALLPLNRSHSLDVFLKQASYFPVVPVWYLRFIQFHIALPYVFGGIAKLQPDWLGGEPVRSHLQSLNFSEALSPLFKSEVTVYFLVIGGIVFDLAIVPLLCRTSLQKWGFAAVVFFHITNSILFTIHIFPWFMIGATTLLFAPDWPGRVATLFQKGGTVPRENPHSQGPMTHRFRPMIFTYCAMQILFPLRHNFYPGDASWTDQGHFFSWRMMLRTKESFAKFYLYDPKSKHLGMAQAGRFVTAEQYMKATRDPEMLLQFAHLLANEYRRSTGRVAEVHALVLTSLNGRKPQLLIDPAVDLAAEPKFAFYRPWIVPLKEPLRDKPWTVPPNEWERHVDLPDLPFLNLQTQISANHQ